MNLPLKIEMGLIRPGNFFYDESHSRMRAAFFGNRPFPHLIIDDFLPKDIYESVSSKFPSLQNSSKCLDTNRDGIQKLKTQYDPNTLDIFNFTLFSSLNSSPFLGYLESITGIKGLIPDPYFEGGGYHETRPNGYLAMHTDFRVHRKLSLLRKLNLILYLNEEWRDEYGGFLELECKITQRNGKKISPIANRAVLFQTDDRSLHGHPSPLECPLSISRRSLALYYYVATPDIFTSIPNHSTQYSRTYAGSTKWLLMKYRFRQFLINRLIDYLPPILFRALVFFITKK